MQSTLLVISLYLISSVLATLITFWLSRVFRTKSTNLELHKFYKAEYPSSIAKKQRYEDLAKYFLVKEGVKARQTFFSRIKNFWKGKVLGRTQPGNTGGVSNHVKEMLLVLRTGGDMTRDEIMRKLKPKDRVNFHKGCLIPALNDNFVETTTTNALPNQDLKYRLTKEGIETATS